MKSESVETLSHSLIGWRSSGEYLTFGGLQMFYRRQGSSSEVVLCLHGFPTASYDYRKIWADLADQFTVIAFDMIGYGFSDKPTDEPYTTSHQVDQLEALLESLGVTSVHILAHDYGNTITQELLARDEERKAPFAIKTICFLNGALFPETHRPVFAQKLLIGPAGAVLGRFTPDRFFKRSLASIFGPNTQPTGEELEEFVELFKLNGGKAVAHRLIQYMKERAVHRERWVGPLMRMKQPFLFINGSADPVSGKHLVERFRELVPHKTNIVELPAIGHFPHLEAPLEVVAQYLAFRHGFHADPKEFR